MRAQQLGAGLLAPSQSSLEPFVLHRPTTVPEAVDVLGLYPDATVAAGCTDLVAQCREGRAPERVVSVRRLPGLQRVSAADGTLRIGAGLTHHRGSTDAVLREHLPALAAAWGAIATVRIRYSATLGGNLMARRTRYEMPVILGALGARLEFAASSAAHRPVDWLWESDPWSASGLLTGVVVDTGDLLWFGYERSMRPLTTVAAAVRGDPGGGRTVTATVGSEYHPPVTLTASADTGEPDALTSAAERAARGLPDSVGDGSASAPYRRHLTGVLLRRLLTTAAGEIPRETA